VSAAEIIGQAPGVAAAGERDTCGFSDISYFNRSFRRHFGKTPTQARGSRQNA
jgi:methylphosphotriester-DNA--protein-cysteine methyltransferase